MNEIRVADVLREARDLLSDPKAWVKGEYCHYQPSQANNPYSGEYDAFCAAGAILVVLAHHLGLGDYESVPTDVKNACYRPLAEYLLTMPVPWEDTMTCHGDWPTTLKREPEVVIFAFNDAYEGAAPFVTRHQDVLDGFDGGIKAADDAGLTVTVESTREA